MLKVIQPFLDPRDPNDVFSHAQWPETPFYLSLTSVRHRVGLLLQRLGCLTVRHPWAFTITQTSISVLPQNNWSAAGPSKWAHASCADAVEVCAEPILQHSLLVRHFPLDCTEHGLNTADMSLRIPLLGWKVFTLYNWEIIPSRKFTNEITGKWLVLDMSMCTYMKATSLHHRLEVVERSMYLVMGKLLTGLNRVYMILLLAWGAFNFWIRSGTWDTSYNVDHWIIPQQFYLAGWDSC